MTEKEQANQGRPGALGPRSVAWAGCGALTKSGNANMEPSRLHWTCHCVCRPRHRAQPAMEREERRE